MNTPWLQYGLTEQEWQAYIIEYAQWLDSLEKK
jgi:hypothetical protein